MHFRQTYNQAPSSLCALDVETLAPAMPDGAFPPWPSHRPVVASLLTADQAPYGRWAFTIESVTFDDEAAAIQRIDELLTGRRALTYNGRSFDLPVLAMTAARASVYDCMHLTDAWMSDRYRGSHLDLADLVTSHGAAPRASLELLCGSANVPVKTQGHGGDVATMLREQGIEAVQRYCEEDVGSTLVLFAMVQALRTNDPAYAASLICDFASWVGDTGLEHLDEFRKLSGNAVLERVRLLHRVEEGIRTFDDRATATYFDEQARVATNSRHHTAG